MARFLGVSHGVACHGMSFWNISVDVTLSFQARQDGSGAYLLSDFVPKLAEKSSLQCCMT